MAHDAVPADVPDPLPILDAELVPIPALRAPVTVGPTFAELVESGCVCGNVTARGHNGLSCMEVIAIRTRVTYSQLPWWRRVIARRPEGWPR